MTAQRAAESIEGLIIDANSKYATRILRVQNKLYDDLVTILKFIELDDQGYIKQTAGNRQILRAAQLQFDKTISSTNYADIVQSHVDIIPGIDEINNTYFASVSSAFKPNRAFIKSIQSQSIETINSLVLQDGLAAQVKIPLNQILQQNINTGGSFSGMLDQLRTFIKGDESVDGRLLSYSRTILRDSLFQYARTYQNSITEDLGLVWFRYVGGIMDKSREFCRDRNGGYFHQKEIESWANLDWKGKNPLTTKSSIFILVAGFNCVHQLIAVSDSVVPSEDKKRASDLGFI